MKKVRKFVREMSPKGEFEAAFLKCFDQMYQWAHAAEELLKQSSYKAFYQESIQKLSCSPRRIQLSQHSDDPGQGTGGRRSPPSILNNIKVMCRWRISIISCGR